jgi:uncharacterized protein (DUF1786 family)
MTPAAATTLNDELEKVEALGIKIVSEEESRQLSAISHLELKDFDFELISKTFESYGVSLNDLQAIAVAVFDHGNAPAGVSDRQFRFDYLDERLRARNSLSAFAYLANDIPPIMTRLRSVADSAGTLPCPLVVMDTAPAAVLWAIFIRWHSAWARPGSKVSSSTTPERSICQSWKRYCALWPAAP